ncbi:MAG: HDIG domain-containing protein [bacterium]|nr:HDIG domain-containing protein [bacterium]
MNIEEAQKILDEFVESESLQRHCKAVASSMKYFAKKHGEDEDQWYITGLLHDFDYEKYPKEHPMKGEGILRERGVDEEIIRAIQSHANYTNVSRDSLMEKTLYAVDELSGFVVAVAQVRPDKMQGMNVKSVKKKLKDKGFAAAVNRGDISEGAEELGIEQDELIQGVIEALSENDQVLGLK